MIIEQIQKVGIVGILPIYFMIFLIVCLITVSIIVSKKENFNVLDELSGSKKSYKFQKLYFGVDNTSIIFVFILVNLVLSPFIWTFDVKFKQNICNLFYNRRDFIGSILIGMTSIAMSMVIFVILFEKEYYLLFSIREVLQNYRFLSIMYIFLVSFIIGEICAIILPKNSLSSIGGTICLILFQLAIIYNIIGFIYISFIIITIMLSDGKSELKLLTQIYKRFWIRRIDTSNFKKKENWTEDAIGINLEYLIEDYKKIIRKRKIVEISNCEFVTTVGCYKQSWYKRAMKKYIILVAIMFAFSTSVNIVLLKRESILLDLINIAFTICEILMAFVNHRSIKIIIIRLFSDTWGYYICTENGKEKLIPRVALRLDNVYDKFIHKMNSINAFFYIWIKYSENDYENFNKQLDNLYNELKDANTENLIMYLPLFTIGYFVFENENYNLDCLHQIYKQMIEKGRGKYQFDRMIVGHIYYLTAYDETGKNVLESKIPMYLKWISGEEECMTS